MTYLFFSSDLERINIYLENFINKFFENEEKNVVKFNANENSLKEVIDECNQLSLAFNKKVVILKDAIFLKKETKYSKVKKNKILKNNDYESFETYIKSDNSDDVILIILYYGEDLDKDGKIFNAIKNENRKFLTSLTENDWPIYIKKYFEKRNIKIQEDAIQEIILRCNGSLQNFVNEANKLELYVNNEITLEDVKEVVIKPNEDDIFSLTKALLNNDKNKSLEIYRDLRLTQSIEPITLISLMTNTLILIDEVKFLLKNHYTYNDIAETLKIKSGKVYYALQDAKKIRESAVKKALKELALLDKKIKHSEVDRFYAFEIFLLNFNV